MIMFYKEGDYWKILGLLTKWNLITKLAMDSYPLTEWWVIYEMDQWARTCIFGRYEEQSENLRIAVIRCATHEPLHCRTMDVLLQVQKASAQIVRLEKRAETGPSLRLA